MLTTHTNPDRSGQMAIKAERSIDQKEQIMQIRLVHKDKDTVIVQRKTQDGGKWNTRKVVREITKAGGWRSRVDQWCKRQGYTVVGEING